MKFYLQTPFRFFESYLRILTGLNEDDIQLILKQNNSKFKTYKSSPGVYTFKVLTMLLSRAFRTEFQNVYLRPDHIHDKCDSILIDGDNVSLITKLTLRPDITDLRFDEKLFYNTILGFSPLWDYKNFASYDREYYSEKNRNFNTKNKNNLKCDVIDGNVVSGLRQPTLYTFVPDKPPGYKKISEPETIQCKK